MTGLVALRRATVLFVVLGLLALACVRLVLSVAPPEREAWTLFALNVDRTVLFARMSRSSTGFYDDQVTTRLVALPTQSFAVEHRAMLGPALAPDGAKPDGTVLQPGGSAAIASGSDVLAWAAGTWHLHIGSDALQARADLPSPEPGGCPPGAGSVTGVLGVGDGGDVSGAMVLEGTGVVVHTVARGIVTAPALYVLTADFSAGVDPLADCPAWVRAGKEQWSGPAPEIVEERPFTLGSWTLVVHREGDPLRMEAFGHLLTIERLAGAAVGWPEPIQVLQRVTVEAQGPGTNGPHAGLILSRSARGMLAGSGR